MLRPPARHSALRGQSGQTLILVAFMLPLFLALLGLVVDGGSLMVQRREVQNAADATALAAAATLAPYLTEPLGVPTCDITWATARNTPARKALTATMQTYSARNKGAAKLNGGSCIRDTARCSAPADSNCYTWPYGGTTQRIEVRLRNAARMFLHVMQTTVSARAVAGALGTPAKGLAE